MISLNKAGIFLRISTELIRDNLKSNSKQCIRFSFGSKGKAYSFYTIRSLKGSKYIFTTFYKPVYKKTFYTNYSKLKI